MTNDFGTDTAENIAEYISQGTDMPTAPTSVFVTLYDDAGNELNADLQNGRVEVTTGTGFNLTGTTFTNANEINFGEATTAITVQEFALKDQDADDATAVEFIRANISNAPQDFANGTRVFFEAGDLDADVLD